MYPENPENFQTRSGWIEVICGSMFSGKTEELIRRLKRAIIAKQKVKIFKPVIDNRYASEKVVSHDAREIDSVAIKTPSEILAASSKMNVIGIDEAQFFDESLTGVVTHLANRGLRVIVAGLDMDFSGNPFGPIPSLLAIAEQVTKVHAVCMRCGQPAQYSHRISADKSLVIIGEKDKYEPLCRTCYSALFPPAIKLKKLRD
ncbi:MAG: thymidine kinase [Bacteroidetes bacterium]|nr:thymidine kinase [Bacteroidota bacterium]